MIYYVKHFIRSLWCKIARNEAESMKRDQFIEGLMYHAEEFRLGFEAHAHVC